MTACSCLVPTGAILPFAGADAPSGYLMCDGRTVDRVTYSELFALIGTVYGDGDGTTTFALPDLRGRVPAGRDDMGGTAAGRLTSTGSGLAGDTPGAAGGAETHRLTIDEMPAHSHKTMWFTTGNNYAGGNGAVPILTQTAPAGGDQPHNNVQPSLIVTFIIKA